MKNAVVVGHGLAGRYFHCPLIRRQPRLRLHAVVARDDKVRAEAESLWEVPGYASLDQALADPAADLIVIATPHDTHAELAVRVLEAGKDCVVDKVMALSEAEADRMIAARDASGRLLSVFHNRRWDWDYLTLRKALADGLLGRPVLFESSVCRYAPPRTWRGRAAEAGTLLHDWGAHLVDQALQLAAMLGLPPCGSISAWLAAAPWPGVDSGGHGRMALQFGEVLFLIENSRMCRLDRPRWWVVGTKGGYVQHGVDPQEDALRAGNLDAAAQPPEHQAIVRAEAPSGDVRDVALPRAHGGWDAFYANIADHLHGDAPLAVTAEEAREVVRVLDAAWRSARERVAVTGRWGDSS